MSEFPKCQIENITKNSNAKLGAMNQVAKKIADLNKYVEINFGNDLKSTYPVSKMWSKAPCGMPTIRSPKRPIII